MTEYCYALDPGSLNMPVRCHEPRGHIGADHRVYWFSDQGRRRVEHTWANEDTA